MATRTRRLARLPATEGARALAFQYLDEAKAAARRLRRPRDEEALHDLRVALRRLRTTLATYEDLFADTVSGKSLRRLRKLARATGPARDTEVEAAWVSRQPGAARRPDESISTLLALLEKRHAKSLADVRERAEDDLPRLFKRLRKQLRRAHAEDEPTLGRLTAKQLRRQGRRLSACLARVKGPADALHGHQARIAAKRLRYQLDPFTPELTEARALVRRLKRLQDSLGEMHDLHVMLGTLSEADEAAHKGGGLSTLAARARQRLGVLHARLDLHTFEKGAAFEQRLDAVAAALSG
ncbi:CHAD domain-containing protein [Myxococcaceae bacterium GXIMD 01537]